MQLKFLITLLFASINLSFSQNRKETKTIANSDSKVIIDTPENGKIENGYYICNKFDWKITVLEGYKITSIERVRELENKGHQLMKEASNVTINPHPTHLIGFELDKYNYFSASFESLQGKKNFTFEEHKKFVEQLFKDSYSMVKELKFEIVTSDMKIGKYNFYKIHIKLFSAKTSTLLLTQELYNSYIDNNLFSASINYTNQNVGNALNNNFIKSLEQ